MALNWDISEVENKDEVCFEEIDGKRRLKGETEGLIWACMAIDMGQITDKTVDEFVRRMKVMQAVHGAYLSDIVGPVWITEEDVRAHKGLHTNVGNISKRSFDAKMKTAALEKCLELDRRAQKEEKAKRESASEDAA